MMGPRERFLRYLLSSTERPADPERLADIALELDLEGALYAALRAREHLDQVPERILRQLRKAHVESSIHGLTLLRAAQELRMKLAERGIAMHTLKGVALFESEVVTNVGARDCIDLDVMTRPVDRDGVLEVAYELGYRSDGIGGAPKHLPELRRDDVVVEVHEFAFWGHDGKRFALAELATESEPIAFTLVHLVHHMFVSSVLSPALVAKTLTDVAAVRRIATGRPRVFSRAAELAKEAGIARELQSLLSTVEALATGGSLHGASSEVVAFCDPPSEIQRLARVMQFYVGLMRGPRWLTREALRSVFYPNRASMESIYGLRQGSRLAVPAYVVRPLHLGFRFGQRLVRALLSSSTS